jgi:uncharacterized protein (TIGR00251 family)
MILFVEAKPNSKKNQIEVVSKNMLKIKISAPPVDGKANEAIIEYLSEIFKIPKSKIILQKGSSGRFKRFEIFANNEDIIKVLNSYK